MIIKKTKQEIEKIKRACKIVAKVLDNIEQKIKPGVTTRELDAFAEEILLQSNAKPAFKGYRGYKHATCISVNEEVVHGIPSDKILKEGDIVGIDVGSVFEGYYGDSARTYPVGPVSKQAKKLISACKKCLTLGISQALSGRHLGDIGAAIETKARKEGFSVVKDLFGHGIGASLHEDPLIPNFGKVGDGPQLYPGMVLAIEPMLNAGKSDIDTLSDGWTVITKDKKLSAHFEHTILIAENGPEILTRA